MARYIDAEATLQIIDNYAKAVTADGKVIVDAVRDIVAVITPTADVEEVVRCKDCKYCITVDDLDGGHWECIAHYDNHGRPYIPKLDGFCDRGEKRLWRKGESDV